MDDVISAGDNIGAVIQVQHDLIGMMKLGGFELKKWASNSNEILIQVPESDREVKVPIELNTSGTIQALEIAWNTTIDSFEFKSAMEQEIENRKFTRRIALSTMSKLFDPIGFIAPILVTAKILMKKVWSIEVGWDDFLPQDLRQQWIDYIHELNAVPKIRIPRWIDTSVGNQSVQIHGFCDASSMAYGAVLYLRIQNSDNEVYVHLISSKSKVAPKKVVTIPRLELCGAYFIYCLNY